MVLLFSGFGFLVPVIGFVALIIGVETAGGITGDAGGNVEAAVGYALFGLLAAAGCWIAGRRLNDPAKDRLAIEKSTGKEIRIRTRHSFLFIPLEWWAVVYGAIAALLAIGSLSGGG